jgi:hypothetical protein
MEGIYERPADYDLEHQGDDEDVEMHQLAATSDARGGRRTAAGRGLESKAWHVRPYPTNCNATASARAFAGCG